MTKQETWAAHPECIKAAREVDTARVLFADAVQAKLEADANYERALDRLKQARSAYAPLDRLSEEDYEKHHPWPPPVWKQPRKRQTGIRKVH